MDIFKRLQFLVYILKIYNTTTESKMYFKFDKFVRLLIIVLKTSYFYCFKRNYLNDALLVQ